MTQDASPVPLPTPAQELQELIETLTDLAHKALDDRDAHRDLCETWSAIACQNAIDLDRSEMQVSKLRDALLEALKLALDRVIDFNAYERLRRLADEVE
jgi:hypothetical protein